MEAKELLHTKNLTIGYKKGKEANTIAGPLNLSLRGEQLVCLLGPNGAGKSTLIRTLSGLQPMLHGSVIIEGKEIAKLKPVQMARRLSMVLTNRVQSGNLNVYTVIALGRYPYTNWLGTLSQKDKEIIDWAIRVTETEGYIHRKLDELSDGESQKVMLARALAQDTPVVILDEPTAHLDLPNRISLMRLLHKLARSTGKAIMLSTHDLDLALQTADEVWLMKQDGAMVKGVPEDLVLNGTIEEAFHKEGFHFDKDSGTFIVHGRGHKKIQLIGDGAAAFWTKRALLREGYQLTNNAEQCIQIIQGSNAVKWLYQFTNGESEHYSVGSLLHHMRLKSKISNQLNISENKK
jgi:iron complex transport system ATP-binding protein